MHLVDLTGSCRMLKKAVGDRLPDGRGSVNNCKQALAILSRARKQAEFCLFEHPASLCQAQFRSLLEIPRRVPSPKERRGPRQHSSHRPHPRPNRRSGLDWRSHVHVPHRREPISPKYT
jgi:hypothetical protein